MRPSLILAADGSESGLTLLHQVLVHLGHSVVLAATGGEAVTQAARHRPDAIVLDLQLDGEDPLNTLRALATRGWAATTPVIALADAMAGPIPQGRFASVVRKPIVLPVLAAALQRCLRPEVVPLESSAPTGARGGQWIVLDEGSPRAAPCG